MSAPVAGVHGVTAEDDDILSGGEITDEWLSSWCLGTTREDDQHQVDQNKPRN